MRAGRRVCFSMRRRVDQRLASSLVVCYLIGLFFINSLANFLFSMSRSDRNSMVAALFASDNPAASSGSLSQPNSSSSSQGTLTPIFSDSSSAQLSPKLLATVVQAVISTIAAEQAPCFHSNPVDVSSQDDVQSSVAISESSELADAQTLGPYTSSLLGIGSSLPPVYSSLAASSQHGRPTFGVPSFVATFAPPSPSLVSFRTSTSLASGRPVVSSDSTSLLSGPILHKSLVIGPGFPPIPASLVNQIVSGKYVDLCDLLSSNLACVEPEQQVLVGGRMVLSACPKKTIEDIVSWIEAFTIYSFVLTSHFPYRWRDLAQYKLRILSIYQQYCSKVWLAYDRSFREHAAATNLSDWSQIIVQLLNFHASGPTGWGSRDSFSEAAGDINTRIFCKSWNRGHCTAPGANCRYAHRCSSCDGSRRATVCPRRASSSSRKFYQRRASSSYSSRSRSMSKRR